MWYYASGGQASGPIGAEQMADLLRQRQILPGDLVWREGMADWQSAASLPELASILAEVGPIPPPLPDQAIENRKIVAGVLALILGSLGIHKFYLGMPVPGTILLLGTLITCGVGAMVTHVIALVEGIIYLSKSDADFYRTYIVEKRQWF